jgi:probable H4MPT-linked C1 transfer pathway protein
VKRVLGLDIGGANLKMAHTGGAARTIPFELWKQPRKLPAALRELIATAPLFEEIAVTMTGELCDCFETRQLGVESILDAVDRVRSGTSVAVWCTEGRFVSLRAARQIPLRVASANWLALAKFAGRFVRKGPALLVDVGSTTTDIVPLVDGVPCPRGRTDHERLAARELVYAGARRTPVCAVYPGGRIAAEFFATVHDLYLVLRLVPEDPQDHATADGRPATRSCAHARLARMLGGDAESIPPEQVKDFAMLAEINHCVHIALGMQEVSARLPSPPSRFVLSGSGEFLARRALKEFPRRFPEQIAPKTRKISLAAKLDQATSTAACAYAVAVLAAERSDA